MTRTRCRRRRRPVLLAAILAVASCLGLPAARADAGGTWRSTKGMGRARVGAAAVKLKDGRVLLAGGMSARVPESSAEIFDPASSSWTTVAPMAVERAGASGVLLASGRVLVLGGSSRAPEIFDPVTNTWSRTAPMVLNREGAAVTGLPDGRALVSGGYPNWMRNGFTAVHSAEIYNPVSDTWTLTGEMVEARGRHTSTLLADGNVLVVGGLRYSGGNVGLASTEIYSPGGEIWSSGPTLNFARFGHTTTQLTDGEILVSGGCCINKPNLYFGPAEQYVPAHVAPLPAEILENMQNLWRPTRPMNTPRFGHGAALLDDGTVLVAGGTERIGDVAEYTLADAELFDPHAGTWTAMASMIHARSGPAIVALDDGSVLVAGGIANSGSTILSSAERWSQS